MTAKEKELSVKIQETRVQEAEWRLEEANCRTRQLGIQLEREKQILEITKLSEADDDWKE